MIKSRFPLNGSLLKKLIDVDRFFFLLPFVNAHFRGILLVAASATESVFCQCSGCAFCHLGSERAEWPVNSSLLTLDHLFRWKMSREEERELGEIK